MSRICLAMIFKDDAATLERALESVKPWIQSYFLIDAGSKNGCMEIAKRTLHGMSGALTKCPWVTAPPTRTSLIRSAKQYGDYLLLMEPDEIFQVTDPFGFGSLDKDCYEAICRQDGVDWKKPFLLHSGLNWKGGDLLVQDLHSSEAKSAKLLFETILFQDSSHRVNEEKEKLEEALKKEPRNARLVFHYARTCERAGCAEEALEQYEKRIEMAGDPQEIFYSLYRVAALGEKRGDPFERVIENYLLAYHSFPSRAEPLYDLAERMIQDENYVLGYVLSEYALTLSPQQEPFFQKRWIYEYGLLAQFARCAFEIKRFDESRSALERLQIMENPPPDLCRTVKRNLAVLQTEGGVA